MVSKLSYPGTRRNPIPYAVSSVQLSYNLDRDPLSSRVHCRVSIMSGSSAATCRRHRLPPQSLHYARSGSPPVLPADKNGE